MKTPPALAIWLGALLGVAALVFVPVHPTAALASRNTSGTYALPTGNPVTSHSTISSTWANTTLGDIGTELTNSLDRQGRGAMLAPIALAAGSSTAPSLAWSSELNTGPYRAGSKDIRFQVNSTTLQKWTDTGVSFPLDVTVAGAFTANGAVTLSGSTTITAPLSTTLAASSNWTFTGGSNFARYWKDAAGMVHVEASGTYATSGGTNPFNAALPAGYRPFGTLPLVAVRASSGGTIVNGSLLPVSINTSGVFAVSGMSNADAFYLNATYFAAN